MYVCMHVYIWSRVEEIKKKMEQVSAEKWVFRERMNVVSPLHAMLW